MAFKPISVETTNRIQSEQYSFDDKGDMLEGHLVDSATLTKDGKSFQKYTVKAADGTHYSTLGSYQLDQALSTVELGTMVRITFQGKKKLAGGKSVKVFLVESDDTDVVPVSGTSAPKSAKDTIAAMRAS